MKKQFKNQNYKRQQQKPRNSEPVTIQGVSVQVRDGDFNFAMRKFKKKVQDSGKLQTLREKEFYEKPSLARKRAKAAARARWLKKMNSDPILKAQRDKRNG